MDDDPGIEVTVRDLKTGHQETRIVRNDYFLLVHGSCYLHYTQVSANGTHQLTIKGRRN